MVVDFKEGDSVVAITGGVWKDTVGVIQSMNDEQTDRHYQCRAYSVAKHR